MVSGLKASWKMVSLHCQQEPNRTSVFCIHGAKEADVSPQLALHCLSLLIQVPMYSSLGGKGSLLPQGLRDPLTLYQRTDPYTTESATSAIHLLQAHTWSAPSTCAVKHSQDTWSAGQQASQTEEGCWVLGLRTHCSHPLGSQKPDILLSIQLQYTTIFRQCDSSVVCCDSCPNSIWCPFI